jgi:hypothetical protein
VPDGVVCDEAEVEMKYPLRIVTSPNRHPFYISIADGHGAIVCDVTGGEWGREFAEHIVRSANRWRWRKWFRPKERGDWQWERNVKAP